MNVLALDLSLTATGVAHPDGTTSTWSTKAMGVARLKWFRQSLVDLLDALHVEMAVIEGYSFATSRQASRAHSLGELGGVMRLALFDLGVTFVDIPPKSVKKYATGKGNANKNEMLLAAAKRLAYQGSSNDEADALWLRAMTLDHYGNPPVVLPADHRAALTGVEWPPVGVPA